MSFGYAGCCCKSWCCTQVGQQQVPIVLHTLCLAAVVAKDLVLACNPYAAAAAAAGVGAAHRWSSSRSHALCDAAISIA
jgi:hypothetical protein